MDFVSVIKCHSWRKYDEREECKLLQELCVALGKLYLVLGLKMVNSMRTHKFHKIIHMLPHGSMSTFPLNLVYKQIPARYSVKFSFGAMSHYRERMEWMMSKAMTVI
jgi:hypothetical protein